MAAAAATAADTDVPHTRGDEPKPGVTRDERSGMFPTHVGMNRGRLYSKRNRHVPHTRGDEPRRRKESRRPSRNVPHTRGDEPPALFQKLRAHKMFPTHVGMNRAKRFLLEYREDVPHTRGDEPGVSSAPALASSCSPHTWG